MLSTSDMNVNRNRLPQILVLFPGSLGDMVCVLPALELIHKKHSQRLTLAARGEALALGATLPCVAECFSLEMQMFAQLFSPPAHLASETRRFLASFSSILSWYGSSHAEVEENLRLYSGGQVQAFPFFLGQEEKHAAAYYLQCIGEYALRCPSLVVPQPLRAWSALYWRQQGWSASARVLVMHPGSGGRRKRWNVEGFQRIARWWRSAPNRKTVVLLGPAEEKEAAEWRQVGAVATNLSVWQVAALLSRADLYLGNDSGVSHVAGAVGARGAVLFGPTSPQQWRPLGGHLLVLRNAAYRAVFPAKAGIGLHEISEEEVIARLTL